MSLSGRRATTAAAALGMLVDEIRRDVDDELQKGQRCAA